MTGNDLKGFRFRETTRAPFETDVKLRFDRFGASISGFCADLSVEGMFVKTKDPKPVGTLVQFEFTLPEGEVIQGLGDVVWIRPRTLAPNKPPGMGVQFRYLDPHSRELIFKIVEGFLRESHPAAEPAEGSPEAPSETEEPALPEPAPALAAEPTQATPEVPPSPAEIELPEPFELENGPRAPADELSSISFEPEITDVGGQRATAGRRPSKARILVAGGLLVAVAVIAGFLLRQKVLNLVGLGPSADEPSVPASTQPAQIDPSPGSVGVAELRPAEQGVGGAPEGAGVEREPVAGLEQDEVPPAAEPQSTAEEVEPIPEELLTPPGVFKVPSGPTDRLTRVEDIRFEQLADETVVTVLADGDFSEGSYEHFRLDGQSPRQVIRISQIRSAPRMTLVPVGSDALRQIRVGYHPSPSGNQVHIVLDLAAETARVTQVDRRGSRLVIHVSRL